MTTPLLSVPSFADTIRTSPTIRLVANLKDRWRVSIHVATKDLAVPFICTAAVESPKEEVLRSTGDIVNRVFHVTIEKKNEEQLVPYTICDKTFKMVVPAIGQNLRQILVSCNGFQRDADEAKVGGIEPMWKQFVHHYGPKPPHLIIHGGDQIYADRIWHLPSLQQWNKLSATEKGKTPFTPEMEQDVRRFYLDTYINQYRPGTSFAEANSRSAGLEFLDDHDIFDGYGSYEPEVQNSPVFKGIGAIAREYYFLFQQHVDPANPRSSGVYLENSYSRILHFEECSLLLTETRFERTLDRIFSEKALKEFEQQLRQLPATTKHAFILFPVPIFFPDMSDFETVLAKLDFAQMRSDINTVDLVDDLKDHFDAKGHQEEMKKILEMLIRISKEKGVRITILGGDVHLGAIGVMKNPNEKNHERDPNYMVNLISSPIGNIPAPKAMKVMLGLLNEMKRYRLNDAAEVDMEKISAEGGGKLKMFVTKRNWIEFEVDSEERVQARMFAESKNAQPITGEKLKSYRYTIPPNRSKESSGAGGTPLPVGRWWITGLFISLYHYIQRTVFDRIIKWFR